MILSDEAAWKEFVEKNQDPYGKGVIDYAERWANLIEEKMAEGASLIDVADSTSHEANTDGITGFMYGAAVATLAVCWIYGDDLRKWHNIKYQMKDEGEKANQGKGVLNPAIMEISE